MADQPPNESIANTDTLNTLRYRPLQQHDEIRLLRIVPDSGATAFKCNLVTECLSKEPEYAALSYTWGDTDAKYAAVSYKTDVVAKTPIECDGSPLMITTNLYAALLALRDQHDVTAVWVDQICIDQENALEKGHQIQQMQNIYAKAKITYVWLGLEDDAATAFLYIKDFALAHEKELYGLYSQTSDDYHTGEPRFTLGTEGMHGEYYHWHHYTFLPQAGSAAWASLWDVFARPWFRRVWVIQEFLASRAVKVLAGSQECTGMQLRMAAAYIDIHQLGHLLRYDPSMRRLRIPVDNCFSISTMGKNQPLSDLLDQTRRFLATDLRDNVFALTGLCKDLKITPDYSLTVAEVFINTATALIKNENRLDVLSQVHWPKDRDDIPSWVPDWSEIWRPPTLVQPPLEDPRLSNLQGDHLAFPSPSILTVHGYTIDEISTCSEVLRPQFFDGHDPRHPYLLHLFRTMVKPLRPTHKSSDSLVSSFYKTLITNYITRHLLDAGKPPDIYHHDWTNFHIRLVAASGGVKQAFSWMSAELFARHAGEKCNGRRLFVTQSGRLGLGPAGMKTGDKVVLLVGANVPFVVRTEAKEKDRQKREADETAKEKEMEKSHDDQDGENGAGEKLNQGGMKAKEAVKQEYGNQDGIESQIPASAVATVGAGTQATTLEKKDDQNRWIIVGETYIHGIDEWLQSEDSKDLEQSKVALNLV